MGARITSLDVARLAGVSQSAVSRSFTPGRSVSPRTRAKVEEAARKLGYRPNRLARGLITGRSRTIGLVVAYLDNHFYPVALERLSRGLQARGYHVMVFLASNSTEGVSEVVQDMLDHQVDGIVAASVALCAPLVGRCAEAGIPVVLFNRGQDDARLSVIASDNRGGGRRAAELLVAGGHERIAHLAGWQGASTGRDRKAGFLAGLSHFGVTPAWVLDGMYKRERAAEIVRERFRGPDRPDALFVGNDHMAFAAIDVLRHELGLDVPGDVAVVGYDDVPLAAWPAYDLTTLRQPVNRMVDATVETLLARIEARQAGGELPPRRTAFESPLVVRGSTRPVADPLAPGGTDEDGSGAAADGGRTEEDAA
jgi:DNA-binding LacI/PurR family transcriptional regulator